MSWSEVKKINSDMNKPLDMLIEEKTGAINATGGTASTGGIFAKLNKLLTDWTTARAGKIDSIDTTVSSRASQASVDAKASQTSVSTLQTTANAINSNVATLLSGRTVKSVQRGFVETAVSMYSTSVGISAVDMSKSLILVSGNAATNYNGYSDAIGEFASNTVLVIRSSSASDTVYIFGRLSWQVIEFY